MRRTIERVAQEYYFTFGNGEMSDYYQPIIAKSYVEAQAIMRKHWGKNYMTGYTKEEFSKRLEKGIFTNLKPLKTRTNVSIMTAHEMRVWQKRMKDIVKNGGNEKQGRLESLQFDIVNSTNLDSDPFAAMLLDAVQENMDEVI